MKSFQSLLGILIFTSLFTACPIFSADDQAQDKQAQAEQESIMQRLIGPGSLARGLCGYCVMLPERPIQEKKELFLGVLSVAAGAFCLNEIRLRAELPEKVLNLLPNSCREAELGIAIGAVAVLGVVNATVWLYEPCKNVGVMRNIQRAEAGKPVEDSDIESYINALFDMLRGGHGMPLADLRLNFLESYPSERLSQLQDCAIKVLIETGRCREKDDRSGIECVVSPQVNLGPIAFLDNGEPVQFLLLRRILHNGGENEENEVEAAEQQGIEECLNVLLGYTPKKAENVKRAEK